MRLCCFCSMRKLDEAYRILPCRMAAQYSHSPALMLRHVAESALSINVLDAGWPKNSEAEPAQSCSAGIWDCTQFQFSLSWNCPPWTLQQRWAQSDLLKWNIVFSKNQRNQLQPKRKHGLSFTSSKLQQILREKTPLWINMWLTSAVLRLALISVSVNVPDFALEEAI